jgi:hypothetical protein
MLHIPLAVAMLPNQLLGLGQYLLRLLGESLLHHDETYL